MTDFVAHAESSDLNKINGLLENGLIIVNTMLVMEADISQAVSTGSYELSSCVQQGKNAGNPVKQSPLVKGTEVEAYNTEDLSEYLKANFRGFGEECAEEQIREELSNQDSHIYVIRKRGHIASSVTTWKLDDETVSVENIFTVPSYRGRHYASGILMYVLKEALAKGYKRVKLTVYGDDAEAILMYHKFGFSVTRVLQEFR